VKVDIVHPNLEISGTIKYMGGLASGFTALGHQVRLLYTGSRANSTLIEGALEGLRRERYAGEFSHGLFTTVIGSPLLRLFATGVFAPDQSVNVLGNSIAGNRLARLTRDTDLIIFSSLLAYPPTWLLRQPTGREVMIFHEGIGASFLPRGLRGPMQSYSRTLARRVRLCIAITRPTEERLRGQGICARTVYDGFFPDLNLPAQKEPFVLLDSRWVWQREPQRVLSIARLAPSARFVMVGRFPEESARVRLIDGIRAQHLQDRIDVRGPVEERELVDLYRRARVALRWVIPDAEDGFSYSLVMAVSAGCVPVLSAGLGGAYHLAEEVSPELVGASDSELAGIVRRLLTDDSYFSEIQTKVLAWRSRRPWSAVATEILHAWADGRTQAKR
jgi:glycosyltransferase involved in cell wall biosynthesis